MDVQIFLKRQAGITLIESMIAVFVLSVGLLGIAGLHGASLSTGQSALNRTRAVLLADDLLERMHANRTAVLSYDGWNIPAAPTPLTVINPYNGASTEELDRNSWTNLLQHRDTGLPQGRATVAVTQRAGTASVFDVTVTITWRENNRDEQYLIRSLVNNAS